MSLITLLKNQIEELKHFTFIDSEFMSHNYEIQHYGKIIAIGWRADISFGDEYQHFGSFISKVPSDNYDGNILLFQINDKAIWFSELTINPGGYKYDDIVTFLSELKLFADNKKNNNEISELNNTMYQLKEDLDKIKREKDDLLIKVQVLEEANRKLNKQTNNKDNKIFDLNNEILEYKKQISKFKFFELTNEQVNTIRKIKGIANEIKYNFKDNSVIFKTYIRPKVDTNHSDVKGSDEYPADVGNRLIFNIPQIFNFYLINSNGEYLTLHDGELKIEGNNGYTKEEINKIMNSDYLPLNHIL